jgi:autotransporter-associated beta strand protein
VLNLGGANTYAGTTTVSAGGLLVNGANSGVGLATVASGARIGGTGSLAGGLTIASGGLFVFNPADPTLDVSGAVSLANSFSVSSLVNSDGSAINWGSVADGTYQLIGTTASSFANILNFGAGNAATIAAGRTAYFTDGSLNLVIVPEPGGLALAGLGIAAAAWARRRRR